MCGSAKRYKLSDSAVDNILSYMGGVISEEAARLKTADVPTKEQMIADFIVSNFGCQSAAVYELVGMLAARDGWTLPKGVPMDDVGSEDRAVPFLFGTIANKRGGHNYRVGSPVLVLFEDVGVGDIEGYHRDGGLRAGNHLRRDNIKVPESIEEVKAFIDKVQTEGVHGFSSYVYDDHPDLFVALEPAVADRRPEDDE